MRKEHIKVYVFAFNQEIFGTTSTVIILFYDGNGKKMKLGYYFHHVVNMTV